MITLTSLGTERVGRPTRPLEVSSVDARALAENLRGKIRGEVRFDDGSRALYATGAVKFTPSSRHCGTSMPLRFANGIPTFPAAFRATTFPTSCRKTASMWPRR